MQCGVLQGSAAEYHEHLVRHAGCVRRCHLSDSAQYKAQYAETCGAYGSQCTWRKLVTRGLAVDKERVQNIMQPHGIKDKRRFKVTTESRHELLISANLLNCEFAAVEPGRF